MQKIVEDKYLCSNKSPNADKYDVYFIKSFDGGFQLRDETPSSPNYRRCVKGFIKRAKYQECLDYLKQNYNFIRTSPVKNSDPLEWPLIHSVTKTKKQTYTPRKIAPISGNYN